MCMNNKFVGGIAVLFLMFVLNTLGVVANDNLSNNDYSAITSDKKIIQVLDSLNKTSLDVKTKDAILGNNITNHPIKIMFTDLSKFSGSNETYEALTCLDKNGHVYILINNEHKDAPVEALMSLLSHEVIHQDNISSRAEELQGWMNETIEWMMLKKLNPELNNIPANKSSLVDRLNTLEKMYINADYSYDSIYQQICINPAYQDIAQYSPGYDNLASDLIAETTRTYRDFSNYIAHK